MEDSEKTDCVKSVEIIPKKSDLTNIDNKSEDKLPNNKNIELNLSKIDLNKYSENLKTIQIETINTKENSSEEDPQIQHLSVPTFKKPDLFIGPRKGKPISRKIVNPNDPQGSNSKKSEVEHVSKPEVINSPQENQNQVNKSDIYAERNNKNELDKSNEKQEDESNEKGVSKEVEKHMKKDRKIIEKERQIPLQYMEPSWGGKPEKKYKTEVLKSGLILETINLSERSFYIIGRLPMCDIALAHPTISRYHAVFQYRKEPDEKNEKGLYVYDLGSTHGTFWNGIRIRPNIYVRVRGGHMIRFGNSQRKFIIQTPPEEEEEETELTVTELKEKRRLEMEERMRMELEQKREDEEAEKLKLEKEENEGINWGMSEDADEETDLKENPFAQTNNEELFLEDPKKTLRGWFEREGHELQYQSEENGIGRFTCYVDLPIEDFVGRTVRAEACVKGKKKESVIQCALEACRILDRHGLLRQAVHEGRKKKVRNWEEEDFYDSDEDNFLDRTGTVEKKREQRMKNAGKLNAKAETYNSLTEKHSEVVKQIENIEDRLRQSQHSKNMEENSSVDALDAFMSNLKSATILNKSETTKLKMDLQKLHKEEAQLLKLIEISRPANLPALKPQILNEKSLGHKRKSTNESITVEKKSKISNSQSNEERETKEDEKDNRKRKYSLTETEISEKNSSKSFDDGIVEDKETIGRKSKSDNDQEVISKRTAEYDARERNNEKEEIKNVLKEENEKILKDENTKILKEETDEVAEVAEEKNDDDEVLKKKRRNMKRIQQRALKAEKEKIKSYDEEEFKEDYCTWVPPEGQSGDGKTSLNEKFGY